MNQPLSLNAAGLAHGSHALVPMLGRAGCRAVAARANRTLD